MKRLAIAILLSTTVATTLAQDNRDYRLSAREFRALQGQYDMEGGRTAHVFTRGGRYFVQVTGAKQVELMAVAPYQFVGVGLPVSVHFNALENGVVTGFTMRMNEEPSQ
jgi:hypothetical protein